MAEPNSSAKWYFDVSNTKTRNAFYDLFFQMCKKYNVDWSTASPKDKCFVEEVVRLTWEKQIEKQNGVKKDIRPSFSA